MARKFILVNQSGHPDKIYQLKGELRYGTLADIREAIEYELNTPKFTWSFVIPLWRKLKVPKASTLMPPPETKTSTGVDFMDSEVESREALMLGELQALKAQLKIEIEANNKLRVHRKELLENINSLKDHIAIKEKEITRNREDMGKLKAEVNTLEKFKKETIEGLVHMANFRNWYQRTLEER